MIFNHWFYILLLTLSTLIFFNVPVKRRKLILWLSGVIFYAFFATSFLPLILLETIIIYILLGRGRWRIAAGVIVAVTILAYFKYRLFLSTTFMALLPFDYKSQIVNASAPLAPLAISFFTFEFISLIVDAGRGKVKNVTLSDLAGFIFFFPTLVAGPIKRFPEFNPQIVKAKLEPRHIFFGLYRVSLGFFKKIVIADTLAVVVGDMFGSLASVHQTTPLNLWVGIFAYSLRIYFDFSGYSDIAIGSARLFGIIVPENFIRPYLQPSIAKFWQNWHRSLYTWIIDYIYIPLGGSRKGLITASRNILIAFAISGLWHGASWHFVLWGLYHGLLLVFHRLIKTFFPISFPVKINLLLTPFSTMLTFCLVSLGWLLFITSPEVAVAVLLKMTGVGK